MNTRQTGKLGENIACDYLRKNGYRIVQRNFERKVSCFLKSEIDIVAKKQDVICFIEVKALKGNSGFFPEQKVNFAKKRKLIKTAEDWLTQKRIPLQGAKWQIDIIAIRLYGSVASAKIDHFENAVSALSL